MRESGEEGGGGGEVAVEGEVSFGIRSGVVVGVVAGAVEELALEDGLVAAFEGEEVGFKQDGCAVEDVVVGEPRSVVSFDGLVIPGFLCQAKPLQRSAKERLVFSVDTGTDRAVKNIFIDRFVAVNSRFKRFQNDAVDKTSVGRTLISDTVKKIIYINQIQCLTDGIGVNLFPDI